MLTHDKKPENLLADLAKGLAKALDGHKATSSQTDTAQSSCSSESLIKLHHQQVNDTLARAEQSSQMQRHLPATSSAVGRAHDQHSINVQELYGPGVLIKKKKTAAELDPDLIPIIQQLGNVAPIELENLARVVQQLRSNQAVGGLTDGSEIHRLAQELSKNGRQLTEMVMHTDSELKLTSIVAQSLEITHGASKGLQLAIALTQALKNTAQYERIESRYALPLTNDLGDPRLKHEELIRNARLPKTDLLSRLARVGLEEINTLSCHQLIFLSSQLTPFLETLTRLKIDQFSLAKQIANAQKLEEIRLEVIKHFIPETAISLQKDSRMTSQQEQSLIAGLVDKIPKLDLKQQHILLSLVLVNYKHFDINALSAALSAGDAQPRLNAQRFLACLLCDALQRDAGFLVRLIDANSSLPSMLPTNFTQANSVLYNFSKFIKECQLLVASSWLSIKLALFDKVVTPSGMPYDVQAASNLSYALVAQLATSVLPTEDTTFNSWLRERERDDQERRKRLILEYVKYVVETKHQQKLKAEQDERQEREKRLQIVHALIERYAAALNSPELLSLSQVNFIVESVSTQQLMQILDNLARNSNIQRNRGVAA